MYKDYDRVGVHDSYKNVYTLKHKLKHTTHYLAEIRINGRVAHSLFDTAQEAAKFIDRHCIKNNLTQKNNSYVQKMEK